MEGEFAEERVTHRHLHIVRPDPDATNPVCSKIRVLT